MSRLLLSSCLGCFDMKVEIKVQCCCCLPCRDSCIPMIVYLNNLLRPRHAFPYLSWLRVLPIFADRLHQRWPISLLPPPLLTVPLPFHAPCLFQFCCVWSFTRSPNSTSTPATPTSPGPMTGVRVVLPVICSRCSPHADTLVQYTMCCACHRTKCVVSFNHKTRRRTRKRRPLPSRKTTTTKYDYYATSKKSPSHNRYRLFSFCVSKPVSPPIVRTVPHHFGGCFFRVTALVDISVCCLRFAS